MKFLLLSLLFYTVIFLSAECRVLREDNISTFNVLDFGASGDGYTDDTSEFSQAWKAACSSKFPSPTMVVPYGYTFSLRPLEFNGPCSSNDIRVKIDGTLTSHGKLCGGTCKQWLQFHGINGIKISGSGTINPQGSVCWGCKKKNHNNHHKQVCKSNPTGFVIAHCNNVELSGLNFIDSPQKHIGIERSTYVKASNLTITAPKDSPNTDGIHIQHSQNIIITKSHIGTGDDCISIGDGSKYLNISGITCGPGHGISVGSLGKDGQYETVEYVYVNDVELYGTSNGVRIKTWQGGSGFARNINFENIRTFGSRHPIIIDQDYCDHEDCKSHTSAVEISNIRYTHVYGTSEDEIAVKLDCSDSVPCKDIYLTDINLRSIEDRSDTKSTCRNVEGGRGTANVSPRVPCLNYN